MQLGVFIPIGNNGWLISTTSPQYLPSFLKPVQLGRDFGNSVEVTAGIAPSDRVIDSPPETLQSGDAVQLAPATPPPSAQQVATQPPATKTD